MPQKYRMHLVVLLLISGFLFTVSCKSVISNGPGLDSSHEGQEKSRSDDFMGAGQDREGTDILESDVSKDKLAETAEYKFYNQDILFPFDDYSLSVEARNILKDKAKWMKNNPDISIVIEGHCDVRGTLEYNLALGDRRAESAKSFLVDLGIDEKRIRTISYGEERPLDQENNESAWAKNRRAHFVSR